MARGPLRLFAGRRITLKGTLITIVTIVVAFGVGIAAGWGTSLFADSFNSAQPSPSASPSPSSTPRVSPTFEVSVPPLDPVTRDLDDDDRAAGLRSLDFPYQGDAVFQPVPVATEVEPPEEGIVRYVRIDVEQGLSMIDGTLATFVMSALTDAQGWAKEGPTTFIQTEGAPDVRIVFASPFTAAALCPTPHEAAALAPDTSSTPSPTPSSSTTGWVTQCAEQGTVVISVYDWIQGLEPFAEDRTAARQYLLNHGLGHVLGRPDVKCSKGLADVMVNQRTLSSKCTPNPWPFPEN
ncbi:DUF3152 domain-containing protein [Demequina sp.]|uniref:DUF3152 domain-containing protein n=1 Tax=Demequina sp. TaxID=2050685 RepID=UPI003D0C76D1